MIDQLMHNHILLTWEKSKPLIEDARKTYSLPNLFAGVEYLYNEMKKREQQPTKIG